MIGEHEHLVTCQEHLQPRNVLCGRCGDYECPGCTQTIGGEVYCRRCVADGHARDYLDEFKERFWGKRDGWAWLIGLGSVASIFVILATIGGNSFAAAAGVPPQPWWQLMVEIILQLFHLSVGIMFFLGVRQARLLLLVSLLLGMAHAIATMMASGVGALVGPGMPPGTTAAFVGFLAGGFVLQIVIVLAILQSSRNQLFFQIEISRKALLKLYLQRSNPVARASLLLGLLGLIPISLPLAIAGLMKVDRTANPPVGGKGSAIGGIVLSLMWGACWVMLLLSKA